MAGIKGFSFPFRKGTMSFPEPAEDDDCVAGNIIRSITERKGSRVMRDGGGDIWAIVFENTGPLLRARIDYDVRRSVAQGEPRANIRQVEIQEKTDSDGNDYVDVGIVYSVNGVTNRLVTPFPR